MACEFDTVDYRGVPLRCSHQWWVGHILAGHGYMAGQQGAVITALRDPYYVAQSGRRPNRRIYYRPLVLRAPYTNEFLLVVADYPAQGQRFGRIVTAYYRRNVKRGETVIWTRPSITR